MAITKAPKKLSSLKTYTKGKRISKSLTNYHRKNNGAFTRSQGKADK